MPQAVLAFCTCPDAATASRIAAALVGERLAACVSVLPGVQSVYRWQDAVERADAVQVLITTVAARLPALVEPIVALPPHELPQVLAVEVPPRLPPCLDGLSPPPAPPPGGPHPYPPNIT